MDAISGALRPYRHRIERSAQILSVLHALTSLSALADVRHNMPQFAHLADYHANVVIATVKFAFVANSYKREDVNRLSIVYISAFCLHVCLTLIEFYFYMRFYERLVKPDRRKLLQCICLMLVGMAVMAVSLLWGHFFTPQRVLVTGDVNPLDCYVFMLNVALVAFPFVQLVSVQHASCYDKNVHVIALVFVGLEHLPQATRGEQSLGTA